MIEDPSRGAGLAALSRGVASYFSSEARLQRRLVKEGQTEEEASEALSNFRQAVRTAMGLEGDQEIIVYELSWHTQGTRRKLPSSYHHEVVAAELRLPGQEIPSAGDGYGDFDRSRGRIAVDYTPEVHMYRVTPSEPLQNNEVMRALLQNNTFPIGVEGVRDNRVVQTGMQMFRQELRAWQAAQQN